MRGLKNVNSWRRRSIFLLALCFLFVCICPSLVTVSAAEDVFVYNGQNYRRSTDVPAVYIVGARGLNVETYVSCTVVAVDAVGGKYQEVADPNATVRIRGNSTSSGPKMPYNIKFSSSVNLFGMGKGKKYCLIANLFDPTLIRNQAAFDFAREIGLAYTPDSMLVDVYFNGKYMGCYQLSEAITAGSDRVDLDLDNGDFILERDARTDTGTTYFESTLGIRFGINEPDDTTIAQATQVKKKVRQAEDALRSNSYAKVKEEFDIPSMVDEYICLELFKNVDIDCASTRFYCKDGKIYGGPVWDFDLSSGNCSSTYYVAYNNNYGDSTQGLWCDCLWFGYLLKYKEFREALYERYIELQDVIVNLYQDNTLGKNYIDRIIESASTSIKRNYSEAEWVPNIAYNVYQRIPDDTYEANVEYLRTWLRKRNAWLLQKWGIADRAKPVPKDEALKISGDYLTGFSPRTSVLALSKMFSSAVICNAEGAYVSTGAQINGGGVTYIAVVDGDLDGDGEVTAVDYLLLKQIVQGTRKPERAMRLAGCLGEKQPSEQGCEKIRRYCTEGIALTK